MQSVRLACATIFALCACLNAQTSKKPAFEVASIKPAPSMADLVADIRSGKRGVGVFRTNIDGARVDMGWAPLNSLIAAAYRLKPYQIVGPDWLGSQAFEIHATIPEGAAKDQVPEMLQTLLEERFKLSAHRENKEQSVYALLVSKDGHKMKEAVAEAEPPVPAEDPAKSEKKDSAKGEVVLANTPEGQVKIKQEARGLVVSGGRSGQTRVSVGPDGTMSLEISKMTMADFAATLTQLMDRPVVNMTELNGSYQLLLELPQEELMGLAQKIGNRMGIPVPMIGGSAKAMAGAASGGGGPSASDPSGGAIFRAIQKLGLKLDSRKAPVETLLIDHIEKAPTEN
jgi:uncharacterized protein (TIGR03435 family)